MTDIKIVEPNSLHYKAFIEAAKQMQIYFADKSIVDEVGKRESKEFLLGEDGADTMSFEDFNCNVVGYYANKRLDEEHRPVSRRDPTKKIPPEYFYFVMQGDDIIGSVSAMPRARDEFDIKNGVRSYEKWDNFSPQGARVETSMMILPKYRGVGIGGDIKRQFFNELNKEGIEEVAGTVVADNARSNNAQKRLLNNYGGKSYYVCKENAETKNNVFLNRYIVNTDTSGAKKDLYLENKFEIKDKALNEVLDNSINKLRSNPYGKKLFENAMFPVEGSNTEFSLSKIYIGYAGMGVGANCYREKTDETKTRDVIYISDEEIKATLAKTLSKSDNLEVKKLIEEAYKQDVSEPISRFQEHIDNQYKTIGEKPDHATISQRNNLKLFAQIEKVMPLEKLIKNEEIKEIVSDSLTNLLAHEVSHAGQYNNGCKAVTKQSYSMYALNQDKLLTDDENKRLKVAKFPNNSKPSISKIKESRAFENALEAGAMSSAMVAFVLTNPSEEALDSTIENNNLRSRIDIKELLEKYDLDKMRKVGANNEYTKEAINLQNSLARDVFVEVVKGMDKAQQDNLRQENPNTDCSYDYTKGAVLESINSSYRKEIFGEKKDFDSAIQSIVSSNRLSGMRDKMGSYQTKTPLKNTQDLSNVDFNKLRIYQKNKEND